MKIGLKECPSIGDLSKAYDAILQSQTSGDLLPAKQFALFAQWSRFDARLAELCVSYLFRKWSKINPVELNFEFMKQPWPAVLGVFLEFCPEHAKMFKLWRKTATSGIPKAHWELFFIGKRRIGGSLMRDDARFCLSGYYEWGYLGRDVLTQKGVMGFGASYLPQTRVQILNKLLEESPSVTSRQYWLALRKSISIRQAERDLSRSPRLKKKGNTKGSVFVAQGKRK